MNITLAFYGIPRCTSISAPSIETNLLKPLRALGRVTVVCHLWQIDGIASKRSGENARLRGDAYDYFREFGGRIERAEAFEKTEEFALWKSHGDPFHDEFVSLRNLMHQLQSLKRVTALAKQSDPDIVVFARPDLQYHDSIPPSACRFVSRVPRTCVVPIWNWWGGVNDRFAICGRHAFEAYGLRVEQAVPFARATSRPVHSESLVRFALRRRHVWTLAVPLRASRVRIDGKVRSENFDHLRTGILFRGRRDALDRWRCRATRMVSEVVFRDAGWDVLDRNIAALSDVQS